MGVKGVNYTIVNSRALREPISAHFHFAHNLIIFAFTGLVGKALGAVLLLGRYEFPPLISSNITINHKAISKGVYTQTPRKR